MSTECLVVSANKLRLVVTTLCFGGVFLWIISGLYLDAEERFPDVPSRGERGRQIDRNVQLHPLRRTAATHQSFRRLLEARGDSADVGEGLNDADGRLRRLFYGGNDSLDGSGGGYDPTKVECSGVHKLKSNDSKCTYIRTVDSCQNDDGLLNYLKFIYCMLPYKLIPLAMVVLFFWLVFLFIFLGATAEEYFCPALTVMSQVLHLSQNVTVQGVTLLALGNGAPDIFSAFAAISQTDDHKSSLAIGALFGAGIFVTTVVVGSVALIAPIELTKRPFLRDIIFYTIAVFWTFYLLWTNTVTIYMATGFIALYVVYVLVVILGRVVYQKWKKKATKGQSDIARPPISPRGSELDSSAPQSTSNHVHTLLLPPSLTNGDVVKKPELNQSEVVAAVPQFPVIHELPEEEDDEEGAGEGKEKGMLHHVVQLSSDSEETETQVYPGGALQITTSEKESVQVDVNAPGRRCLHLPPSQLLQPPHKQPPSQSRGEKGGSVGRDGDNREERFSGASAPLFPQFGALLAAPTTASRRSRRSVSPTPNQERGWRYTQRRWLTWDDEERPRSTSPRKLMKKTLSGALDVSEEVVAAVGIPHVPQIWEEIHKVHHRKSPLTVHRSRESGLEESHRDSEQEEEEEEEESASETTPFVPKPAKRKHPFLVMLLALYPFGEDFNQLGIVGKIYEIVKYPCAFILTLTVPVIDHEADLHNWNRWLNIIHCVTGPMMVALLTKRGLILIGGVFPVWTLILIVGVIVAIVVACTSRNDKRPVYHCAFAWLGFAIAVVWIYVIANEIVNLLQAFGVVVKLSDGILGLTLLAWGNSIGDAVANMTMARQGFPRMAIGACYGGPLLNILIGVGVASLYKSIKRKSDGFKFKLYFSQVEFFAAIFLMAILACSLAAITLFRFRVHRPFSIFLIAIYVMFLIIAILAEVPVFTLSISGVLS